MKKNKKGKTKLEDQKTQSLRLNKKSEMREK